MIEGKTVTVSNLSFGEHEKVAIHNDPALGLRVIIAIHSTALGPSAGGTRFRAYASNKEALGEALALSRAMALNHAPAAPCAVVEWQ